MTIYDINSLRIKWENREKKRKNMKNKWIKHGERENWWKQVDLQNKGISRQWKSKIWLNKQKIKKSIKKSLK